jgi:hypothetical protein
MYGLDVVVAPDAEPPTALTRSYSLQNYLKIFSPAYRLRTILVGSITLLMAVVGRRETSRRDGSRGARTGAPVR